jgi:Protein of unknown function (DUF3261)
LPRRAFAVLSFGLLLAGCATGQSAPHDRVRMAPGLDLVLPGPDELGRSLEATQLVTARYGDQTVVFEGHISATPERLLLVIIDQLGRKALSVTWDKNGVAYDAAPWLPSTIPPQNMLADIITLYWPDAAVSRALAASGGRLVANSGTRSVLVGDQEVIHAEYQPASDTGHWVGHAIYRNLPWHYELDIQSVLTTP